MAFNSSEIILFINKTKKTVRELSWAAVQFICAVSWHCCQTPTQVNPGSWTLRPTSRMRVPAVRARTSWTAMCTKGVGGQQCHSLDSKVLRLYFDAKLYCTLNLPEEKIPALDNPLYHPHGPGALDGCLLLAKVHHISRSQVTVMIEPFGRYDGKKLW